MLVQNKDIRQDLKLVIVIVNYRTSALTLDCIASLHVSNTVPHDTQIVVVDGNSEDGSVQAISEAIRINNWINVTCLPLDFNGGFSFANNRGIEYARLAFGDPYYYLLLNPDTIARPGSVDLLVSFMDENPGAGIAGSQLEHPDGTRQSCAFRFPSIASEFESEARIGPVTRLLSPWCIAPDMPLGPSRTDWVSGASMIFRRELLEQIAQMDEGYFLYFEEVDFCRRAADAGWSCWHVPESRVIHLVGQSTGVTQEGRLERRPGYWFASRRRYFLLHKGQIYTAFANLAWVIGHIAYRTRLAVQRKQSNLPPRILGDFIRHCTRSGQP